MSMKPIFALSKSKWEPIGSWSTPKISDNGEVLRNHPPLYTFWNFVSVVVLGKKPPTSEDFSTSILQLQWSRIGRGFRCCIITSAKISLTTIIIVSNITTAANGAYKVMPTMFDGSKPASERGCRLIKPL